MTTTLDTNVITALWNEDDALNQASQGAVDNIFGRERLVISGVLYTELLAAARRTGPSSISSAIRRESTSSGN
jgi:predicted nucleic acid-binding protein